MAESIAIKRWITVLVKFALRNMTRNRRRTTVAICTVAAGVFGLLFLQGFFAGLLAMHAENSIHSRNGHGQIMTKDYWGQTFEKPSDHWIESPDAIITRLRADPRVHAAYPRVQFFALLSNGKVNVAGRGQGIDGGREKSFFNKMNFVEGGAIGDREDGLVLGIGLARALNVHVGDRVTILGQTIHGTVNAIDTVISGIFHVGFKEADDMLFQVQIKQAEILLDSHKVETIAVGLKKSADWDSLAHDISREFPGTEALSVFIIDQVWAENGRLFLTALLNIFKLTFLGVILLAIYSSSSTTVLERKKELAMLRANGETIRDLIRLLTIEGAGIAIIGASFGVLLTLLVHLLSGDGIIMPPTPGTNRALPVQLFFEPFYISLTLFLGIATPIFATLLATLQVSKMSIAQALKSPV
jgi:putative ABC transport system permease protein